MSVAVFLLVTAPVLATLCWGANTQPCQTNLHGNLFLAENSPDGAEVNVFAAHISTATPSISNQFKKTVTVDNPALADLSADGVSHVQHERVVVTSTSIVSLASDAVLILAFEEGQTSLLPVDPSCKPHRLYTHSPDDDIYMLCKDRSRVFKLTSDSSGYQLDEINWDLGNSVDSPAVALFHNQQVAAVVLKHQTDSFDYNWIEVRLNIEIDDPSTTCDDTYYINESCVSALDRLVPFNNSHLILECAQENLKFLVNPFSTDCNSVLLLDGAVAVETAVGPDQDTYVVNYGTYVFVQTKNFEHSYTCDVKQQITRLDFVATNHIVLFTPSGIWSCNSGAMKNLSSLSVSDQFFPYFIQGQHLLVVTSLSSTAITIYDVEKTCQFQFGTSSSISIRPSPPVLFAFVETPPTTTIAPSTSATEPNAMMTSSSTNAVMSPTMTSLSVTSSAPTSFSTSSAPTSPSTSSSAMPPAPNSESLNTFHLTALAALIISSVVMSIFLTMCVILLCKRCKSGRKQKLGISTECSMTSVKIPSTVSSSSTSINSAIQETVGNDPSSVNVSLPSNSWSIQRPSQLQLSSPLISRTIQPLSDQHWIIPMPETRPILEHTFTTSTAHFRENFTAASTTHTSH